MWRLERSFLSGMQPGTQRADREYHVNNGADLPLHQILDRRIRLVSTSLSVNDRRFPAFGGRFLGGCLNESLIVRLVGADGDNPE